MTRSAWLVAPALLLAAATTTSCTIQGYGLSTAARFVLPGCCVTELNERDASDYDEAKQAEHPSQAKTFEAFRKRALDHAASAALVANLERVAASSSVALQPGLTDSQITRSLAGTKVAEEVKALYRWHNGAPSCDDEPAVFFSHCLLSLKEALRRREADREIYMGMPPSWLPLLVWSGEVLYVVEEQAAAAASPVLWVSLLSPVEAVAFTNLGTLVKTHLAWQDEGLWPPDALDDESRARFEAVHAALNPGASLPW